MSAPDAISPHSFGIAEALVTEFMPLFEGDKETMADYFDPEGVLYFQSNKAVGTNEIKELFESLPEMAISVSSYDIQTVQSKKGFTMVPIMGTLQIGDDTVHDFHSTLYVVHNERDQTACIKFMTLSYY